MSPTQNTTHAFTELPGKQSVVYVRVPAFSTTGHLGGSNFERQQQQSQVEQEAFIKCLLHTAPCQTVQKHIQPQLCHIMVYSLRITS